MDRDCTHSTDLCRLLSRFYIARPKPGFLYLMNLSSVPTSTIC